MTLLFPAQQQLEASRYPARLRNSHSVGVIIAEYYSVIDLAYPGGKLGSGRASCSSRSRRKHVTRHGTLVTFPVHRLNSKSKLIDRRIL